MVSAYGRFCDALCWRVISRLAPGLRNSQHAYAATLRDALASGGRWLDLGCGHDFLPPWIRDRTLDLSAWTAIGIDMDEVSIRQHRGLQWRITGDIQRLPFRDNSFDLVTANMVVEHVARPGALFAEISRILRRDGRAIIHTPNVGGYATWFARALPDRLLGPLAALLLGRRQEDVYPTYYRANSGQALRDAAAANGLSVEGIQHVESSPQFVRVPPLMVLEVAAIRLLRRPQLAHRRVCLIASFRKQAA
jgi:SAM-dependent methyltransferase